MRAVGCQQRGLSEGEHQRGRLGHAAVGVGAVRATPGARPCLLRGSGSTKKLVADHSARGNADTNVLGLGHLPPFVS